MLTFPELIRNIREEADLTQGQFAKALGVSTILISMIETGQKEVSKGFILRLAEIMDVHPSSITPFLFADHKFSSEKTGVIERKMIAFGEKIQEMLITKRAKRIRDYADA